jgi:CRISPR-associated endonuclease/helicase Cas3
LDLSKYKAKPNKTIREHTDELIKNLDLLRNFNYIKSEKIYNLTKIACEYHDYGKANREFQNRIIKGTKFDEKVEIAHNVLSLYFINKEDFKEIEDYYKVAFAVLNHHNYCDTYRILEDEHSKDLIKVLLSDFKVNSITRKTIKKINEVTQNDEAIMVKGLLHKCDYSASGDVLIEYENNFLENGLNNLLDKWKLKKYNSSWNELQQFCRKNTNNNIVVIAQTGMGKTEAGLHWIGNNKGFFILPLKTAINSIYKRIKEDILDDNLIEDRLALLHSDALSYYNNNKAYEMDVMDYYNHSKQLSIPLSISTLDQLFDFAFKYQGYELKLTTLAYSKVVIDEIQMYSADLLAYLIYGIKLINKFGGKIAILTATLPPFIKDILKEGENPINFEENVFINDIERHNVKTYESEIDADIICKKFKENLDKGISNKILVVCNTVKKVQQVYKEIIGKGISEVNVLHSKFIKCERAQKEEDILKIGKTEHVDNCIWISTQIVEASLDIDFDYLFTELSDLSGLFQRLGRCNRKGFKPIDQYNCFIFLNIDKNLLTDGDHGFIDKKVYEISKQALKQVNGVLKESDKINLINEYLTMKNLAGSDYLRNYNMFSRWIEELYPYQLDKSDVKLRNIISYNVIPLRVYEEHKEEIDSISNKLMESTDNILDKEQLNNVKLEKINLMEEIKKYTVPVGKNDIYFKKLNAIIKKVQLSKNQFVDVVKCHYSNLGFVRLSKEEFERMTIKY